MTPEEIKADYDWQQAFAYGDNIRVAVDCSSKGFDVDDVAEVIASNPGENDGPSWVMAGRLKDGRYFFLDAGCDYTGWNCQAGGDGQVADTLDKLVRFAMTTDARKRLGFEEPV